MPSRYRDAIKTSSMGQLMVTVDPSDRCLLVYPREEWTKVEEQFERMKNMDRRVRNVQRLMFAYATECELDGQGRILVSAPLREYAGLEKESVLVGQMNKFELWSRDAWNAGVNQWLEEAQESDDDSDALSQLSI